MNPKTLEALKESIVHWEDNLAAAIARRAIHIRADSCALCKTYNRAFCDACVGCPVLESTGVQYCNNSPWQKVKHIKNYGGTTEDLVAAVQDELDFLKSLLPEEKRSSAAYDAIKDICR